MENSTQEMKALKAEVIRLRQQMEALQLKYHQAQLQEREQRVMVEALRQTLTTMSSTLDLDKVLDYILDTIGNVTPYDGAYVLFVESDLVHVVRQRGYIEKGLAEDWLKQPIPITRLAALQQMMDAGKPQATPNILASPLWAGFPQADWIQSNVIAPIRLSNTTLGFLSLDSATPDFFTETHAEQLQVFADQAAIAIQNARLYDRAKKAAILEERSRLANELHDTISQTLWSISLVSERLPKLWEVNHEEGQRSLTNLHQMAQGALAEMRSLLLELRPAVLMGEKIGDLIRHFADVIATRTGLEFSVTIQNQEPLPPEVQVVLYRVIQEAVNNIVRHAMANRVEIFFDSRLDQVELTIRDNGRGFDPTRIARGHLGLGIMRDRLHNIGATLETISQPEAGTSIKVTWVVPREV